MPTETSLVALLLTLPICNTVSAQQAQRVKVRATGQAPTTLPNAREAAVEEALRRCVEAAGVHVASFSESRDFQMIQDVIYTKIAGLVEGYDVLEENPNQDDLFTVRVEATVNRTTDINERIEAWKVPYRVFPSLPPDLAQDSVQQSVAEPTPGERPRVVYICSFKSDEPVDVFLETAGRVPGADFLITGRAPEAVSKNLPDNVRLTGFLGEKEYTECLLQAQLIIALTTRAGTLLYGAQEAIALGKPLVLSRTPTLEAYFTGGRVMVENTAESLRCGILDALERGDDLRREMETFRTTCRRRGEARLEELRANLQKFESGVLHAGRKD